MEIRVKVIPNTRKEGIEAQNDGRLIVRVRYGRERGEANERLRELLALHFNVPVEHVCITKGHQQSSKTVMVYGREGGD